MIKVVSDKPVVTLRHICENCCYELEFNNIDLKRHRTDYEGDALETRGMYLVCPRPDCLHRNLVKPEKR